MWNEHDLPPNAPAKRLPSAAILDLIPKDEEDLPSDVRGEIGGLWPELCECEIEAIKGAFDRPIAEVRADNKRLGVDVTAIATKFGII